MAQADLPKADYAVLYSPKTSEPSVWQELNRIRSTVSFTKENFVLVYGGCGEMERSETLAQLMGASGRSYEVGWTDRIVRAGDHSAGSDGSWFEISETFATRWGDQMLACRLMKARPRSR